MTNDRVSLRTGYTVHIRGALRHGIPVTLCGREIREERPAKPDERLCARCQQIREISNGQEINQSSL
jgi:hypothetical protein